MFLYLWISTLCEWQYWLTKFMFAHYKRWSFDAQWLPLFIFCSSIQVMMTVIKYIPQVRLQPFSLRRWKHIINELGGNSMSSILCVFIVFTLQDGKNIEKSFLSYMIRNRHPHLSYEFIMKCRRLWTLHERAQMDSTLGTFFSIFVEGWLIMHRWLCNLLIKVISSPTIDFLCL